jgi:hypothetical protein
MFMLNINIEHVVVEHFDIEYVNVTAKTAYKKLQIRKLIVFWTGCKLIKRYVEQVSCVEKVIG